MLKGKRILVGITGGIAAYKTPLIIRFLVKQGAEVKVVATENAMQFVTTTVLETLSKHNVYSDLFSEKNQYNTEHISLSEWADMMVVAPATANCIGKIASGIADDALSTLLLAFRKPIFLCPAMNTKMYEHFSVRRNIEYLRENGIIIIEPTCGELACGTDGQGRMEEPENIVERIVCYYRQQDDYAGTNVLITAGPTYEKIDAVRFIGNFSTGKMGYAIAEELASRGCNVTLVSGPTNLEVHHHNINRVNVTSAVEMYDAAISSFPHCDAAILSAAVADFRPENVCKEKIKKSSDSQTMDIHLVQNPDILASLGKMKTDSQRLVGFALETHDETANAQSKLMRKNLDFIVLNSLRDEGAGFGHDTNKVTFIYRNGEIDEQGLKTKKEVAKDIADRLKKVLL
ncbi:MAG: bifunctional phosphopantothenoylcysteine decarboxylase/phosphopantothenate--cysteine ligase CoaBC [Bacteroidales bacterium]|nr:bifunctional phosphopantothenoylcysteine decarboxylase/phosphopantothenate--cysteine ligase CoaBC [Bacteroidales bacterium]